MSIPPIPPRRSAAQHHLRFKFSVANAITALKVVYEAPYLWARPQTMQGSGKAYAWRDAEGWKVVPGTKGGEPMLMLSPEQLFEPWQVVSPQLVLDEVSAEKIP